MSEALSTAVLEQLFIDARTHNTFLPRPVPEALLRQLYELARMGPTSANCQPARIVFVQSPDGKAKLKPALAEGNRDKTLAAPVTAIVATDLAFFEKYPYVFPHNLEARGWFEGKPKHSETTAIRNGTLQGGYLILAARALGLACGPMSGFSNAKVDEAFFPGTSVKSNFLINLGFRDPAEAWFPRSPRLNFDEACRIE